MLVLDIATGVVRYVNPVDLPEVIDVVGIVVETAGDAPPEPKYVDEARWALAGIKFTDLQLGFRILQLLVREVVRLS